MPEGWAKALLLEVAQLHDSRRVPLNQSERAAMPGSFPYYGANGQVDSVGNYLFDGDYVLLAEDGGHFDEPSRGVAYKASGKFWVNNHAHILSSEKGIDACLLCKLLNAVNWMSFVSGTTRLKLTQGGMQRVSLSIPPEAEQCRIVAKLDALTARIARARAELDRVPIMSEHLRQQSVYAAFSGRLTTEWRYAHPDAAALSKETLDAAYVGVGGVKRRSLAAAIEWKPDISIPCSWKWASVDQLVARVQYGSSAKTSGDLTGVPVLRMGNIQSGELDWTNLKYLPPDHPEFPELLLEQGDVLFNRTNSAELVGKSAVFRGASKPISFASYIIRVRTSGILPDLLVRYLNSPIGRRWIAGAASQQVGQANVNGSKLKTLGIPLPPPGEQEAMMKRLDIAFARADRLEAEATRARTLLDRLEAAILAKAFRGELVPQNPNDEPASVLLERIRAQRAAAPKAKRGSKKRA